MRLNLFFIFQLIFCCFPAETFAQATSTVFEPPVANEIVDQLSNVQSKSQSVLHGVAKAEASGYTSEIPNKANLNQSLLTTLNFNFQHQSQTGFQTKLDTTVGKYLDWGGSVFGIQEAYTTYQIPNISSQISVGRKIEYWSQIDSDWQLGLWEPKYNLDPLRPVNQGLTGFFYKVENEGHELLAFWAPLFIPTMGPEIREENGALVSDSRWYNTPQKSNSLMGRDTQIVYSLNIPDLMKLVSKPGSGFRYRYGATGSGAWGSFNFAHKPINSLLLKYDAQLYAATSTGNVTVSPDVGYHNLWGWDVGYYLENGMISMSYLQDDPETIRPESSPSTDWVVTQPGQLKMYSLHLDTALPAPFLEEEVGVSVDYLRVFEVQTFDVDSQGENRGALFPYRTQFTNALSMKGKVFGVFRGKPLTTEFRFVRDLDQKGSIYGMELSWRASHSWIGTFGMDILSADDSSDSNTDSRFINQFRANDRVYSGVGYVF